MEKNIIRQRLDEIALERPSTLRSSLSGFIMFYVIRLAAWILILAGATGILWSIISNIPEVIMGVCGNDKGAFQLICVMLFIFAFLLFYCTSLIRKIVIRNNYIEELEKFAGEIADNIKLIEE